MHEAKKARSDAANIETGGSGPAAGTIGNAHDDYNVLSTVLQGRLALRPGELGEVLGIGRNAAYKLCNQADFPTVRIGHKLIIPVDGLRRWLEEQESRGC